MIGTLFSLLLKIGPKKIRWEEKSTEMKLGQLCEWGRLLDAAQRYLAPVSKTEVPTKEEPGFWKCLEMNSGQELREGNI